MMNVLKKLNRRSFVTSMAGAVGLFAEPGMQAAAEADVKDPWSPGELLESKELAEQLKGATQQQAIICVAFPLLYRQRRIAGAVFAGPGSKPEGIALLNAALEKQKTSERVVLYCGCCPMEEHCPNIRPAYLTARELGYKNIRVLNLPTNLHTDWIEKGFPIEAN